eukprot:126355-Chlamydomonas_euryale.AAC.4
MNSKCLLGEWNGGVIPLERSGRVGQTGKVWTSPTRGPIAKVAPTCFGALANAALHRLAAATEIARPPEAMFAANAERVTSFCVNCTNVAPTRNGITP